MIKRKFGEPVVNTRSTRGNNCEMEINLEALLSALGKAEPTRNYMYNTPPETVPVVQKQETVTPFSFDNLLVADGYGAGTVQADTPFTKFNKYTIDNMNTELVTLSSVQTIDGLDVKVNAITDLFTSRAKFIFYNAIKNAFIDLHNMTAQITGGPDNWDVERFCSVGIKEIEDFNSNMFYLSSYIEEGIFSSTESNVVISTLFAIVGRLFNMVFIGSDLNEGPRNNGSVINKWRLEGSTSLNFSDDDIDKMSSDALNKQAMGMTCDCLFDHLFKALYTLKLEADNIYIKHLRD